MRFSIRTAWASFGTLMFVAVATGCWVARASGVPSREWLTNLAAWAIGAALAFAFSKAKSARGWSAVTIIGLACTFLSSGMSGVHRWIGLGPIRVNGAELLLPAFVANSAGLISSAVALVMLAFQPDASQAVAMAGAAAVTMAMSDAPIRRRALIIALFIALAALTCLRHDPLAPVPEVEGIIGLAMHISPAMAALAILSLAGVASMPVAIHRSPTGCALSAYLAISALAPVFGAFPVPLVGMGISPIIGTWLGFGALMRATRARLSAPPLLRSALQPLAATRPANR